VSRPERTSRSTSRRRFLGGIGAALTAGSFAPRTTRAQSALATTRIADGISLISGAGGNIVVMATEAGQVLVDSGNAAARDAVLASVESLAGPPDVVALFNTHWHPDQVGANEALGARGATILAHEKTRQRLAAGYYLRDEDSYQAPTGPAGLPTETIYTEASTTIGGTAIDYGYLIEAHTDGDIYVAFPEHNVIAVGDVISPDGDPVFDWFGGGWLGGRLDSIERLLAISDDQTRFIPGHGPAVGRAELLAENRLYLALFDMMVEHIRLGETAEDMIALGLHQRLGREFADPARLFHDVHKGFWAHHNKLMHDIV